MDSIFHRPRERKLLGKNKKKLSVLEAENVEKAVENDF